VLTKRLIYVSGLPRAGSTLLCQLLGQHPKLNSPGHSSPLCQTLVGLRQGLSDDPLMSSCAPIFAQATFAGATLLARFQQFAQSVQVGTSTELRLDTDGNGAGTSFATLAVLKNILVGNVGSGNVVIA